MVVFKRYVPSSLTCPPAPLNICGVPSAGNVYTTDPGYLSYIWTASPGGTITSGTGTNSIVVTWNWAGAKTVTVTYMDADGCSPATPISKSTNVYALPVPAITGPSSICGIPSAGNIYSTEAGMSGYTWNVSAGGTITNGVGTNAITVTWNTFGSRTVDVTYTDTHGCNPVTPTVKNVGVYDILPVSISIISSATNICAGTYVSYTATAVNGGSSPGYQWKMNGSNVGWNGSTYGYVPGDGDVITCVLTSNYPCPTGNPATSNPITMVVHPLPAAPVSGGDQTVCSTTLPATLTATAPTGSMVDWYNGWGGLLSSGSNTYSTSTAGTYYAESRDMTTGCKSSTRTPITLTVITATKYYRDQDGDGYGNPEVYLYSCIAPAGYVTNGLDCDDNDPNINPGAQYFAYTASTPDFVSSIVYPTSGTPYTLFHFEVDYFDATNSLPPAGYPRLMLDYEGNGSYTDANDRVVIMSQADPLDLTTTDGKRYFVDITGLPYGTSWRSKVAINDAGSSCTTTFGPFVDPAVLHESNIYLFANDITITPTGFHPLSSPLTVSAVIHNESDFDANNFVCHLTNQWDPTIVYPDITVANLPAHENTTIYFHITTPAVDAWCPMEVTIDYTNVIVESNELDNSAVRPFTNGNYVVAGKIVVTSSVSPHTSFTNQYTYLTLSGHAHYEDLAVPLLDPSVAGATVSFVVQGIPDTLYGYTNSWGDYSIYFPAPVPPATYHVQTWVTDYTLTGSDTTHFHILPYIPAPTKPNLTLNYCHSVDVQPVNPLTGATVNIVAHVVNNGNAIAVGTLAQPIEVQFTYTGGWGGTPVTIDYVGSIAPGESVPITWTNAPIPPLGTLLTAWVDPMNYVDEWNETFADNSSTDNMCYEFQPVGICGGNFWGRSYCLGESTGIYAGVNVSHLYDANPVDVKFEVQEPGSPIWVYLGTGTLNNVTRNCYCPYVVSIPGLFTFNTLGIYNFRITVDPNNVYPECDETNNVLLVSATVVTCAPPQTKPNLTLNYCHSVDVHPVNPHLGANVTLVAHVLNNGNAPALGPIQVSFTYGGGVPVLVSVPGPLAAGATVDVSLTTPRPVSGTLLTAYADPNNLIAEWDDSDADNSTTDNMCYEFQPVALCSGNFWARTYLVGQSATLDVGLDVKHLYDANPVKVNFTVVEPDLSVHNLGNAILNNATRNCWCPWFVALPTPYTFFTAGTYTFTITADPDNDYPECDETNNVLVVTVHVIEGADMRVLSQYINPTPLNPAVNEPASLIVSYENIGNSNVDDQMRLNVFVDEVPLASIFPVPGLATGDHNSVAIPATWSSSIPGAHVIRAIINADNLPLETNFSNNQATRAIIVGEAANLYFVSFAASNSHPAPMEYININSVIGNNGDVNATATVKFYYLDNAGDTIPIGQSPVSVLSHQSTPLVMPWNVADNQTTIIGKIVDVNTLEFNPDDNVATTIIGGLGITFTSVPACHLATNGTLTANIAGGTAPYLYMWNTGYIGQTLTGPAGSYTVTVTDNTGISTTATGTITEYPSVVPTISGPQTVCMSVAGSVYTTEAGMSDYTWTASAGGTIIGGGSSSDNTVTVRWNTTGSQMVSVTYTDSHGCTASAITNYNITVRPEIVPTITGPASVCKNSTGNVYTTEAGMSGYIWIVSTGGTITAGGSSTDNSVTVTWTNPGARSVSVNYSTNIVCAGSTTSYPVTVSPLPVPTITGDTAACAGTAGHVYTTEPGNTGYTWLLSTGGTITSGAGTNSITVTWDFTASSKWTPTEIKTVSVSYTNASGCPAAAPTVKHVTINHLPVADPGTPQTICQGGSAIIGAKPEVGATYLWSSVPVGFTSTLPGPEVSPLVTTTYTVVETYTATGCSNSHSVVITVNPLPAAVAGADRGVCAKSSTTIGAPAVAGNTYSWTSVPTGFTSAQANPTVTPTVTTTYTLVERVTLTGCTNSHSVVVTVNPLPVPTLTGPTTACNGSAGNVYVTDPGMSAYQWTIPAGATVTSGGIPTSNSVTLTWTTAGSKVVGVNYTNLNGCTASTPKQMIVTVNPSPVPTITGVSSCCINANTVFVTTTFQLNYVWTISSGGTIVSGQGTKSVTVRWANAGANWIGVNYSNVNGCAAPTPTIKTVAVTSCKSAEIIPDTTSVVNAVNNVGSESLDMNIYPNPNDGTFTAIISVDTPGVYDLRIYSNLGVVIYEMKDLKLEGTLKLKVDVGKVSDGVYNCILTNKDRSVQKRIIIKK